MIKQYIYALFVEIIIDKIIHDLKKNPQHQKELLDPFIPIEINCPKHPKYPLELFCNDEKVKIVI